MALLDGLDAIDWRRYHHAYGPATDVPGLLRALANPDAPAPGLKVKSGKSVFEAVTWTLWGNVFHQGSVWGASARVIPFLVEILTSGAPDETRRFLIDYLYHLAFGYPTDLFPEPFDLEGLEAAAARVEAAHLPQSALDGDAFRDPPAGVDPEAFASVGAVWMRDCHLGVERALPAISPFTDDDDDEVAEGAVALVSAFPRQAELTAPRLWALSFAHRSDQPILAAIALVGLARLGQKGVADAARPFLTARGPERAYAAFAETFASKGRPSREAQAALLEVPEAWKERRCPFAGSLGNLVNRALVLLPPEALDAAVAELGKALAAARGFGKLDPLGALLRIARVEGPSGLDPVQRRAIALIVEHGDWGDVINVNQGELLRAHGLPDRRDRLEGLIH